MLETRNYLNCLLIISDQRYYHRETNKRIVAGIKARKGGFPWQVGIYLQGRLICGGTLINERYALTAAHCFGQLKKDQSNLNQFEVHLGEYDRNTLEGKFGI